MTFLRKFQIEVVVALVTVGLLFYYPFDVGQFALISYVAYIFLSVLFRWIAGKLTTSNSHAYVAHLFAFLIAYSFFVYVIYSFASINHIGY